MPHGGSQARTSVHVDHENTLALSRHTATQQQPQPHAQPCDAQPPAGEHTGTEHSRPHRPNDRTPRAAGRRARGGGGRPAGRAAHYYTAASSPSPTTRHMATTAALRTASVEHSEAKRAAHAELQANLDLLDQQDTELQNTLAKIAEIQQPAGDLDINAYPQGCKVWLPDAEHVWVKAVCFEKSRGDGQATFQLETGEFVLVRAGKKPRTVLITEEGGAAGKTYALPDGLGLPAQNIGVLHLSSISDLTNLNHLHEPAILHFLGSRYSESCIYTRTGAILIAVNPWRWLQGAYDHQQMDRYAAAARTGDDSVSPHIFATAAAAFDAVRSGGASQSILVSGESGAGKTETCKQLIKYFARVASSGRADVTATTVGEGRAGRKRTLSIVAGQAVGIEQRVIECNPLLEAFGNAQTPRNDNSSRFGKFTLLNFTQPPDSGGGAAYAELKGAKIETYLLEKSRVVSQDVGNRNFHVFFQLCASAGQPGMEGLGLGPARSHALTCGSNQMQDATADDVAGFKETQKSLATIGVAADDQQSLFQSLAAVLHMGDITFASTADGGAMIQGAVEAPTHPLSIAVRLLQCDGHLLGSALVSREMHIGSDVTLVALRADQATEARDSLAKALYARVFDFIVRKVNASFGHDSSASVSIGLLDIFGFEYFGEENSFEQLCINFANEKIQQVFNAHVFKLEQKEYERERISFKDIVFTDNQTVLDIFDSTSRSQGFFKLLDEQCKLPNAKDEAFLTRWVTESTAADPADNVLAPHRFGRGHFVIRHFAAPVTYSVEGFMAKNRDNLHPDLIPAVQSSSNALIKALFPRSMRHRALSSAGGGSGGRGASSAKSKLFTTTVGSQFAGQLRGMMEQIMATELHFIRCLNPNPHKRAACFENKYVVDQVRCNGLLDAVHVMREMYGTRIPHAEFFSQYTQPQWLPLLRATPRSRKIWERLPRNPQNFDVLRDACSQLCLALGMAHGASFQIGRSKVFLRTGMVASLGHSLVTESDHFATMIQSRVRGHQARESYERQHAAALVVQRYERQHLAQQQLQTLRLAKMAAEERALFLKRQEEAQVQAALAAKKRRDAAATRIQAVRRGQLVRRVNKIHRSIGIVEEKDRLLRQVVEAREEAEREASVNSGLSAQLTQLREQLHRAQGALAAAQQEGSDTKAQFRDLQAEHEQVTDALEAAHGSLDARARELIFMEEQIRLLKDQLAGKGSSVADLTMQKMELEEQLHESSEDGIAKNGRIESLIKELEEREAEVTALTDQLESQTQECKALSLQIEQSRQEVAHESAALKSSDKKNGRLSAQLELANNQIQLLQLRVQNAAGQGAAALAPRPSSSGPSARRMATSAAARAAVVMPAKIEVKDANISVEDVRAVLSDPHTIMSGYFDKRKKTVSGWKKRYFELKRNSLLYYKDETKQVLKGLVWTESLRVETRAYVAERAGFFGISKDDARREAVPCLLLASSDLSAAMYIMPTEFSTAQQELVPWTVQLHKVVARASYIKKEEALDNEPDSRVLNYVDGVLHQSTMQLSHNELGLEAAVCIGAVLPFAKQLVSIECVSARLDDLMLSQLTRPLSTSVGKQLKVIRLRDNNLTAEGAKHIAQAVAGLTDFTLDLAQNNLGDAGCQHIARMLADGCLTLLDVSDNAISDAGVAELCASLANNATLDSLDLSSNPIRGEGCTHVAEVLRVNTSIAKLRIADCGLSDKSAQELSDALVANHSVASLDVSNNSITNDGAAIFVAMLSANNAVAQISIAGNVLANFTPGSNMMHLVVATTDTLIKAGPPAHPNTNEAPSP
jgi:myosin heavy subunit